MRSSFDVMRSKCAIRTFATRCCESRKPKKSTRERSKEGSLLWKARSQKSHLHRRRVGTNWEELRLDLDDERQRFWNLEGQLPLVERVDSETATVLRHILEDEKKHHEAIVGMLMRSDPQAAAIA